MEVEGLRELLGNSEIVDEGKRGLALRLADPEKEENRFFAHFLWNVSMRFSVHARILCCARGCFKDGMS